MRYITADQIFSGKKFLSTSTVLVLDDRNMISDIIPLDRIEKNKIEHFKGVITPGFINTHCHLELSHLKNVIKQHTGIVDFGLSVMKHRQDLAIEIQIEAMENADKEMQEQGIVAVGDISNTINSLKVKQDSNLYYHTFIELIALNPERAEVVFNEGKKLLSDFTSVNLQASLAAHAPYSASLELIKKITDDCFEINQPTSIHNQESKAENEFFQTKSGDYLRLYEAINLPIHYFKATGNTSLQSISASLQKDIKTLLVHNTFSQKEDLELLQKIHTNLFWCLCPNANLYIENTLPNIALMQTYECSLTIGTDSLASNSKLSIIDEINTLQKHQPSILLETLLQAATHNGAKFLGIDHQFGLIEKNKTCGINLSEGNTGYYSVKKLA
jgi:cytosine/adenosine deaminase-related metal-dependent hydrolase